MENPPPFSDDNLVAMVVKDCRRQADTAQTKLSEVIECLGDENHLGALGSFQGLDEDIGCLRVFLTRIAQITVGGAEDT